MTTTCMQNTLEQLFTEALTAAGFSNTSPQIKPSSKKEFGDYQSNAIMALAKKHGQNPRQLAQTIVEHLPHNPIIAKTEIAGPGFINIFLDDAWLGEQITEALQSPRCGVHYKQPKTFVIDYSSPNVAKQMHVGHLRSTIIGDSIVRTLEFLGNTVIRANHVGDWGTQFGMLIAYLEQIQTDQTDTLALADLETFYRNAKKQYDEDPDFAEKSRQYVVKLQGGDAYLLSLWQKLVDTTMQQCQAIYDRLNVTLSPKDTMGESLYNPMLQGIVDTLLHKKIATYDDGAAVVYLEEFKNKDGEPLGVIVQKKDGGFLYTTTDIAAAQYRHHTLKADVAMVFSDSRQSQHMKQAWQIARMGGFIPDTFELYHGAFGMMLSKDGKPFKTRSGDTIKLADLLDEAITRATALIEERSTQLSDDEKRAVIDAVAIGAVKYADLSKNRNTDYVFDWDSMLSFEGNTAPYIQYAYTRIQSIFAKADIDAGALHGQIALNEPSERALALQLLQFEETLLLVIKDLMPHILAQYLFELAGRFSAFYEHCPILSAEPSTQTSRLLLAKLTANILKTGLDLLGIKTVDKM